MAFSVDTKLQDLIADERAREVLRKHFPEHTGNPDVSMVVHLSLRQIRSYYPEAGISQAKLDAVDKALQEL